MSFRKKRITVVAQLRQMFPGTWRYRAVGHKWEHESGRTVRAAWRNTGPLAESGEYGVIYRWSDTGEVVPINTELWPAKRRS